VAVGFGNRPTEGMGKELIEWLLKVLKEASHNLPEWVERFSPKVGKWLLLRFMDAASPQTFLTLLVAIVLTAFLIGVFLSINLAINLVRRGRARVFISFQHDRDSIANELAAAMARSGLNQVKLPFVEGQITTHCSIR
jgi:hypothetical protein